MKRIEELGISPTPWHTFDDNWVESADGNPAMSNAAYACNQNDARILAAAPELYEALYESLDCICAGCPHNPCEGCCSIVAKCRAALAKASGEEVKA